MKQIEAKIVADSISPQGYRITSMLLTYPRFIHSEVMTHRVFSRNSASSRAIPFEKMVKMVEEDPFIPIAWQKDHKGMQGTEYWDKEESDKMNLEWLQARNKAIYQARMLHYAGVTKQLCNRLLEPFMWHTVLVTATEWDNFFELRCPKYRFGKKIYHSKTDWYNDPDLNLPDGFIGDSFPHEDPYWWYSINESGAEIHIQALAEAMWDVMNESTPINVQDHLTRWKQYWHIPFITKEVWEDLGITYSNENEVLQNAIKIATARCARLSYMTFDGEIDYEKDIKLHDKLLSDGHMSPFEHCARAMSDSEYKTFAKGHIQSVLNNGLLQYEVEESQTGWCNNFRGFISYRYLIENKMY